MTDSLRILAAAVESEDFGPLLQACQQARLDKPDCIVGLCEALALLRLDRRDEAHQLIADVSEMLRADILRSQPAVSIRQTDLFRPVTEAESQAGELSADSLDFVVGQLSRYGVTALGSVLPIETISELRRAADENLACVESALQARGETQSASYREVVLRGPGRYDLQYGMNRAPFNDPELLENRFWIKILRRVLGDNLRCCFTGLVTSKPGTDDQNIHADSPPLFGDWSWHLPPHCCNVFVPLVDLDEQNGATVFFPGSHWEGKSGGRVSGDVPAGSIVVFDYRLAHHGRANRSDADRPVLYLTYSCAWYHDIHNFPQDRYLFGPAGDSAAGSSNAPAR
jgi:hypothetical protein